MEKILHQTERILIRFAYLKFFLLATSPKEK